MEIGKLFIFTAPSGAGKTTIVKHLLKTFPNTLAFSTSATTRAKRPHEEEGREYYFMDKQRFIDLIEMNAFVEWEEVYEDQFYGTLKEEVNRIWKLDKHVVFDIDVKGAMNLKKQFPEQTFATYIKPPSLNTLKERLEKRQTETPESIKKRLDKAKEEMEYENQFDLVLVNDILEEALKAAEEIISNALKEVT